MSSFETILEELRLIQKFPQKSQLSCRLLFVVFVLLCGVMPRTYSFASDTSVKHLAPPSAYDLLKQKADAIESENSTSGWSYIVSGAVTLGISIPAYYLSEDVFAKIVYTVGETLGIAAVGYGSYLVLIENDYRRFSRILKGVPELSPKERDKLATLYLQENAEQARNVRKIKVITFGLTAGLNYLDGFTTSNRDLKTAHLFLAGINTLAALSFVISKSEEEKMYQSVTPASKPRASAELILGPLVGLRVRF